MSSSAGVGSAPASARSEDEKAASFSRRGLFRGLGLLAGSVLLGCRNEESASLTPTSAVLPSATALAAATEAPRAYEPEMVVVRPGSFRMGEAGNPAGDAPLHAVTITRPFAVGVQAVTFETFDRYCQTIGIGKPEDEGWGRGERPVIHVDWNAAVAYCRWLSAQAGLADCYQGQGKAITCDFSRPGYRLPSEAEWEYAARGGHMARETRFAGSDDLAAVGWYADNSGGKTQPVGLLAANPLGIHDLCGNVWEWCWDKYLQDYYAQSPIEDPVGPDRGQENRYLGGWERVRRGGAFNEGAASCTVGYRSFDGQAYSAFASGFRVARTLSEDESG